MPEEFDPAWEYWEPNPEIVEVTGGILVFDTYENYDKYSRTTGLAVSSRPYQVTYDEFEDTQVSVSRMGCKANDVILKQCHCGKEWLEGRRKKKKYCSVDCRNKGVALSRSVKFHDYRNKKVEVPCPLCGKEVVGKGRGVGKKYCSARCRRIMIDRNYRRRHAVEG